MAQSDLSLWIAAGALAGTFGTGRARVDRQGKPGDDANAVADTEVPTIKVPRSVEELNAYWGARLVRGWPLGQLCADSPAARFLAVAGLPAAAGPDTHFGSQSVSEPTGRILLGCLRSTPVWLDVETEQVFSGAAQEVVCLVNTNIRALAQFLTVWDQYATLAGSLSGVPARIYLRHVRRILRGLDPAALAAEGCYWPKVFYEGLPGK